MRIGIIGAGAVGSACLLQVLEPNLSGEERDALQRSADALHEAGARMKL